MAEIPLDHQASSSGRLMALHCVPMNPTCRNCSVTRCASADDDYCRDCTALRIRIVRFVAGRKWRKETSVIRKFGNYLGIAEDTLFHLVLDGMLEWFGSDTSGTVPLNYRIKSRGKLLLRGAGAWEKRS